MNLSRKEEVRAEFDPYASDYEALLNTSIAASGESAGYFAEYKIKDLAKLCETVRPERPQGIELLDFGAGTGSSIPYVKKHLPRARLTCCDVSSESLAVAKERYGEAAQFVLSENGKIPAENGAFDAVFASCVFHHVLPSEQPRVFEELWRVLRAGGLIFIYEHNPWNPLVVRVVRSCPFDENAILIPANVLCRRLRDARFERVMTRYRVFFPGFLRSLRVMEDYLGWLPVGAQYYCVARKAG
jgi:ubiquinone/menaquinone biosynthesis C-methylase UbiE